MALQLGFRRTVIRCFYLKWPSSKLCSRPFHLIISNLVRFLQKGLRHWITASSLNGKSQFAYTKGQANFASLWRIYEGSFKGQYYESKYNGGMNERN